MFDLAAAPRNAKQSLSVVLPNYNHGRYVARALDALLSQDRPADEIIVVDDCSTDDSRAVIARYAAKHPSVRLLANEENMGVIATLSRGLSEARGQYIYFGAADDFVLPGFFAAAIKALQVNSQAGLFCGDAVLSDGYTGRILGVRPPVRPRFSAGFVGPSNVRRLLQRNDNFILTGAAVFRRDAVISAGGFDEQLASFADGYLARKIALSVGFCYAPSTVLTWCIFPDSVSRKTANDISRAQQVLANIEARMASDPIFPSWYRDAFVHRWRFWTSRLAIQENPINHDKLMDIAAQTAFDRAVLRRLLQAFALRNARFLILAFLWLRYRPYSLIDLGTTVLVRKCRLCFSK